MKVAEAHKSNTANNQVQAKRQPFFKKEGEGGFFSKSNEINAPFYNAGTQQKVNKISKAPDSFISKQIQPNARQRRDARSIRRKMTRAIVLLRNARQHLSHVAQGGLLDEMLSVFSQITPAHLGTRDINNRIVQHGRAIILDYNFRRRRQSSIPFRYQVRFALSHDASGTEGGYFRPMGNMGGMIVIKVPRAIAAQASTESIALLLVHEAVHMLSHL